MGQANLSFWVEIIGTIAFASSGAMVGIKKEMDLFGIMVLAVTTALGGGLIRDLVLGNTPPAMFGNWSYAATAVATAVVLFIIVYMRKDALTSRWMAGYERVMVLLDAIGLGAFTVIGIETALRFQHQDDTFLLLFVAVITGVGGGLLRDVMAGNMPFIFVKHIYAVASLCGAVVCIVLGRMWSYQYGMLIGAITVVVMRILAAKYHWNLPKIKRED
ncbi:MAG: trimeric intracellular cation channel family protein [Lachnospiraceae bacterium]|nr:trimeric intracellular cation channel family protein [Lachnospiraceae bacterium]MDY5741996.1 trimeric intracellular cation channel family protein [Lachnospiraceae bacterium]